MFSLLSLTFFHLTLFPQMPTSSALRSPRSFGIDWPDSDEEERQIKEAEVSNFRCVILCDRRTEDVSLGLLFWS